MDVLADVLSATKTGGTVTARVRAAAPWGIDFPDLPLAAFHHVVQGSCWLRRPGAPAVRLDAGDLVLLRADTGHAIADSPSGPAVAFDELADAHGAGSGVDIDLPGPGPQTEVVCGGYRFDAHASHPLLNLPPVLLVRADTEAGRTDLAETLRMISTELAEAAPGAQTITDRLVDVLFVHVLRAWAADTASGDESEAGPAWLTALGDPPVAAAIALMHREPEQPWTVEALAHRVGVSRATLTRRFTHLIGEPPLGYLTRWRMEIAARRLRETGQSVAGIAQAVGYTSEFAFSRAFNRHRGQAPSRYRAAQRR